jgi:hypothetical protein
VSGLRSAFVPELVARFRSRRHSFASLNHHNTTAFNLSPAWPNLGQFAGIGSFLTRFVGCHHILLQSEKLGTPETRAAQDAAFPRFDPDIVKVSIVTTIQMAVVADIEEIGIIRASAWVVSILLVFRLTTTIATSAFWNGPREVDSGSVVRTTRAVVTGPTANPARRFSGCGIRQSRKDCEASPDQDKWMSPPRMAVGRRFRIEGVHRSSPFTKL